MTANPNPSPIKVGDVLLIVRHPDDLAPMEFDVDRVCRKWATGSIGSLGGARLWRVDIQTMQVFIAGSDGGPTSFAVLRSWDEWEAGRAARMARQQTEEAWRALRTELGGRCPGMTTAANIQAARVLLGLSREGE